MKKSRKVRRRKTPAVKQRDLRALVDATRQPVFPPLGEIPESHIEAVAHHLYASAAGSGRGTFTSAARIMRAVAVALRNGDEQFLLDLELRVLPRVRPLETYPPPPRTVARRAVDRHLAIQSIRVLCAGWKRAASLHAASDQARVIAELVVPELARVLPDVWTSWQQKTTNRASDPVEQLAQAFNALADIQDKQVMAVDGEQLTVAALRTFGVAKNTAWNWVKGAAGTVV